MLQLVLPNYDFKVDSLIFIKLSLCRFSIQNLKRERTKGPWPGIQHNIRAIITVIL
jgi:hypothetical protein